VPGATADLEAALRRVLPPTVVLDLTATTR
jgi:hypothetical protein